MFPFLLALTLLATSAAGQRARPTSAGDTYDFTRPTTTYVVPKGLSELSGHAWAGAQQLVGVEDEEGELYFYNLRTQQLDSIVHFAGSGDYEDVTRLPDGWLVLRSDGQVFKRTAHATQAFATGLTAANEPEGLCYDPVTGTLLVACKGAPGAGLPATQRAIYQLDLRTYRAAAQPAYVLDAAAVLARSPGAVRPGQSAAKAQQPSRFAPSAVAVHPRTHHVWVLSARGNDLVELDAQGQLLSVRTLDAALFLQPEGLAFAPGGDLFISSEAGRTGGPGRLYRFAEHTP